MRNVPRQEAALLSVVLDAFQIDPQSVSVTELVRFREKHHASLGRLRASLADLSETLRSSGEPLALISQARDTFRNRVEPALADLEAVLKEARITFFLKSLVGASAISLAPVRPEKAVAGGATLLAESLDYSFSRSRLVREHPYGYLHQVSSEIGSPGKASTSARHELSEAVKDPRAALFEMERPLWEAALALVKGRKLFQ